MDNLEHLFNSNFDNAKLKSELLNKKEENTSKGTGKVQRYRPGVVPRFAKKEEEEEVQRPNRSALSEKPIKIEEKRDERLERLKKSQEGQQRPIVRRIRREAEIIADEEDEKDETDFKGVKIDIESMEEKKMMEDNEVVNDTANRRERIRNRVLEEEKEEMEEEEEEKPTKAENEYEYEYEYEYEDREEEDANAFALKHKPVFISKENRKHVLTPEEEEAIEEAKKRKEEEKKERRRAETEHMIEEESIRSIEAERSAKVKRDKVQEIIPDDTDDLENDEEIRSWKEREFGRLMRNREEAQKRAFEQAEKARRERMTDAEIEAENRRLEKAGIRKTKKESEKGVFLQKYYHKGIFYMDDDSVKTDSDIRNRDAHAPTEMEKVNKLLMPKIMQKRDFGKKSQSKWTYLRNEDTTKNKDWINELQAKTANQKFKRAGDK